MSMRVLKGEDVQCRRLFLKLSVIRGLSSLRLWSEWVLSLGDVLVGFCNWMSRRDQCLAVKRF